MNIIVVEDAQVNRLAPATTGRPVWAVTCGSYRLIDFLGRLEGSLLVHARPYFSEIVVHDFAEIAGDPQEEIETTLIVNGRVAATFTNFCVLQEMVSGAAASTKQARLFKSGDQHAAMILPTSQLLQCAKSCGMSAKDAAAHLMDVDWNAALDLVALQTETTQMRMLVGPHDIIDAHMKSCAENLELRLIDGGYQRFAEGVFVSERSPAKIPDSAVFDTTDGPVMIDADCSIGPFTFFRGPVYVGPRSKITEFSSIKDSVTIGHTCKIGGEIEGVVVESYSNKQHYGFLGHSYLGSWINLGAGTCNSDLKNTYGTVNMTSAVGDEKIATGMQFVGCVMGDYAKTAINTSIFTGKLIGVGSNIYGMVSANVPSFVNYARTIGQIGLLPAEVVVKTQQRMFGRRNVEHRSCDADLIRAMFQLTDPERPAGLSSDPLDF